MVKRKSLEENSSVAAKLSESKPNYSEGDRVLAYHGPYTVQESKIMEVEFMEGDWRYFIHYLGWSHSWDMWVSAHHLMKITEENVEWARALEKARKDNTNELLQQRGCTAVKPKPMTADEICKDLAEHGIFIDYKWSVAFEKIVQQNAEKEKVQQQNTEKEKCTGVFE